MFLTEARELSVLTDTRVSIFSRVFTGYAVFKFTSKIYCPLQHILVDFVVVVVDVFVALSQLLLCKQTKQ